MKQVHFRCTCCRAQVTINTDKKFAPIEHYLKLIPHKMDCYANSIKAEVSYDQGSDSGH